MRIIDIQNLIELYDRPFLKRNVEILSDNNIKPSLAVIKTSNDSGAQSYIRGIEKQCNEFDIRFQLHEANSKESLISIIHSINEIDDVLATLTLYPTPFDLHDREFMNLVLPQMDVEGLHYTNLGYLVQFKKFLDPFGLRKLVIPPTAKGILYVIKRYFTLFEKYYKEYGKYPKPHSKNPFQLLGKKITIVNDSLSVGKSLALMLMNENASVRVCQKYTDINDVFQFTELSDIVISAVPVSGWKIPSKHICKDAILFDIAFEGNFDYPDIYDHCYSISPRWDETHKGNRINDMTLARLISNTLYLANKDLPDPVLRELYEFQKTVHNEAINKHFEIISDH